MEKKDEQFLALDVRALPGHKDAHEDGAAVLARLVLDLVADELEAAIDLEGGVGVEGGLHEGANVELALFQARSR